MAIQMPFGKTSEAKLVSIGVGKSYIRLV